MADMATAIGSGSIAVDSNAVGGITVSVLVGSARIAVMGDWGHDAFVKPSQK